MIPYSTQTVDKSDIKAVVKILKSKFLTQGPQIEKFEKKKKGELNNGTKNKPHRI